MQGYPARDLDFCSARGLEQKQAAIETIVQLSTIQFSSWQIVYPYIYHCNFFS